MDLKYPDPMSKTVDHIIPIAKGGHPSDLANLQLAHRWCNRQKGAKMFLPGFQNNPGVQNNPPGSNGPEISTGRDEETTGALNKPGHAKADSGRTAADNDNLPQHADWAAMKW